MNSIFRMGGWMAALWQTAVLLAGAVDLSKLPAPATEKADYTRDIQPILSAACYECHGPGKQEAGLRLDLPDAALKGGDSGPVIMPGKSAESALIHAVAGLGDLTRMPKKGTPLTERQIALLRAWIDQGADWPRQAQSEKNPREHWAFRAPARPGAPRVQDSNWPRQEIDRFILAKLREEKLKPSPEADKTTLLRRLSLDLIGLPPTPAEVDNFLNDRSPAAYEKQVERLLASPHFGERWGRHWLDAARYADSDGFEKDKSRNVWFYRDWVVQALNRDLPYDQFVIEQLAGDLLPNATQDNIAATGFLRNSMVNEEGGVDPEQFRMDAMFDRMDAIGKTVLGLTIQCAQCHNHKYDPLTQEEYYRLFAFLNNDHEPQIAVYTPEEQMKRDSLVMRMREWEAELKHKTARWEESLAAWEKTVKSQTDDWTIIQPAVEDISTGGQKYLPQSDGSFLALSYAPTKHTVKMLLTNHTAGITGFRLELLNDPNLPLNGPGRSFKGTCALTEFKVEAAPLGDPTNKTQLKFAKPTADFSQPITTLEPSFYDKSTNNRVTGSVEFAIDGDNNTAWGIDAGPGRRNQERKAVFQLATNAGASSGAIFTFLLTQNHGGWNSDDHMNNNLGRFRLSYTTAPNPVVDPVPKRVRDILEIAPEKRSPAQRDALFSYWRTTVPEFREVNDKIEALWKEWPAGTTTLALLARETPRDTKILRRGDFLKPTRSVAAGVPAFLHPLPEGALPTRLTFARWLVDPRSPTTARVLMNRMWQAYFGQGLVSTPEDFGLQSEPPTHPELLDWLATEFMARGWSMKAMHRLIVTSSTYRQSSRIAPELYAKDPFNRLLARGARFRVEGEIVRDIALAASGLLSPQIGGPPAFPPIPQHLLAPPVSYAPVVWNEDTGPSRYRRALYTFRRRSIPYPALQAFDAPNGDFSCVRRARSNTPLQALMTLNETLFVECAQGMAGRVLKEGGKTDRERIAYAFQLCAARQPVRAEEAELRAFLARQQQRLAEGWLEARQIGLKNPEQPDLPAGVTPAQLAAWTAVCRVILNLDETITKE